MILKTEIRYSWIYNKRFNKDFTKQDWLNLQKKCKKFEILYKKHIKQILKLIEKYHSKSWKYDFIPIYVVEGRLISFSDPLTLKYRENEKTMLLVLAHELLHNNIIKKFKGPRELHMYMEPILNKIIRDLPLDLEENLKKLNERIRENYNIK